MPLKPLPPRCCEILNAWAKDPGETGEAIRHILFRLRQLEEQVKIVIR